MQIGVTINLGNYESLKVVSSELPSAEMCWRELYETLRSNKNERVQSFLKGALFLDARRDMRDVRFIESLLKTLETMDDRHKVEESILAKVREIAEKRGEEVEKEEVRLPRIGGILVSRNLHKTLKEHQDKLPREQALSDAEASVRGDEHYDL